MHLVMFDVDGTLCDTFSIDDEIYFKAIEDVLEIKRPESLINFTHFTDPGILVEMVMNSFEREITSKEYAAVRDHFSDMMMEKLMEDPSTSTERPGALDLFNKLKADPNIMPAIATGGWGPTACFKLGTAGFDIERVVMASSDDNFERTEIMKTCHERALKRLDIAAFESITYVGDSPWDEEASKKLGWRFIGVGERITKTENHIGDFVGHDGLFHLS